MARVTGRDGGRRVATLAGLATGIAGVITAAGLDDDVTVFAAARTLSVPRGHHGQVIALTFDDGPNEPYTSQIADVLARAGIKATFFQVGACVDRYPQVTARLARDGHVIGDHSHSHRLTRCLTARAQRSQTEAAQHVITRALGRTPALYRPPWLLAPPPCRACSANRA